MSLEDFITGYLSTLKWSVSNDARAILKREFTIQEMSMNSLISSGIEGLWNTFGAEIEASVGIVGLNRSVSWQAGHDLAFVQNGMQGFNPEHFGESLSTSLTEIAMSLGKSVISVIDGVVVVSSAPI